MVIASPACVGVVESCHSFVLCCSTPAVPYAGHTSPKISDDSATVPVREHAVLLGVLTLDFWLQLGLPRNVSSSTSCKQKKDGLVPPPRKVSRHQTC